MSRGLGDVYKRQGKQRSQSLTLEVEEGVVHQLRLGPVLEPDEVDVLGEGRVLATHLLEVGVRVADDEAHSAVAAHRPATHTNKTA